MLNIYDHEMPLLLSNPSTWDFLGLIGAGSHDNSYDTVFEDNKRGILLSKEVECSYYSDRTSLWFNSSIWTELDSSFPPPGCVGHDPPMPYIVSQFERKAGLAKGVRVTVVVASFSPDRMEDFDNMTTLIKNAVYLGVQPTNLLLLSHNPDMTFSSEDLMKFIDPAAGDRYLTSDPLGTCCSAWHGESNHWDYPYDRISSNFGGVPRSNLSMDTASLLFEEMRAYDVDIPIAASFKLCEAITEQALCNVYQCMWDGSCHSPPTPAPSVQCSSTQWGSCKPDCGTGSCLDHLRFAIDTENKSCANAVAEIKSQCIPCNVCTEADCAADPQTPSLKCTSTR